MHTQTQTILSGVSSYMYCCPFLCQSSWACPLCLLNNILTELSHAIHPSSSMLILLHTRPLLLPLHIPKNYSVGLFICYTLKLSNSLSHSLSLFSWYTRTPPSSLCLCKVEREQGARSFYFRLLPCSVFFSLHTVKGFFIASILARHVSRS